MTRELIRLGRAYVADPAQMTIDTGISEWYLVRDLTYALESAYDFMEAEADRMEES